MARKFSGGEQDRHINISLSTHGIDLAIEAIENYEAVLQEKCSLFCEEMARRGAAYAQSEIRVMDAVDTGQLMNSINIKPGDVIPNGATWIIYTDCPYAQYVEYGTGPRGQEKPHPDGRGTYRSTPWVYYNDRIQKFLTTSGMGSRPFMYNTWEYLKTDKLVREVAKEVFG